MMLMALWLRSKFASLTARLRSKRVLSFVLFAGLVIWGTGLTLYPLSFVYAQGGPDPPVPGDDLLSLLLTAFLQSPSAALLAVSGFIIVIGAFIFYRQSNVNADRSRVNNELVMLVTGAMSDSYKQMSAPVSAALQALTDNWQSVVLSQSKFVESLAELKVQTVMHESTVLNAIATMKTAIEGITNSFDISSIGYFAIDAEFSVIDANEEAARIFRTTDAKMRHWRRANLEEACYLDGSGVKLDFMNTPLFCTLLSGLLCRGVIGIERRDMSVIWVMFSGYPVKTQDRVIGAIISIVDVTPVVSALNDNNVTHLSTTDSALTVLPSAD